MPPVRLLLFAVVLASGCVNYDLANAPSKDLGVGHLNERLPASDKVAVFSDVSPGQQLPVRAIMRCTDAFTTSLVRTDIFDHVVMGTGDPAEIGFEGTVAKIDCTQNYACIWMFYSVFALIAVPANLPLSVDDADYEITMRAIHLPTGQTLGTYHSFIHLHSWRGAWSLFETWLSDPGQIFDRANRELLTQIVDDYPKLRAATVHTATAHTETEKEAPR
jgi:hypothetical protein